jgi:hypothetical protein
MTVNIKNTQHYHRVSRVYICVIMLNVTMLNVILLNVIWMNVILLNFILLNVILLNVIVLNVILLNIILVNVILLNVILLKIIFHFDILMSIVMMNFTLSLGWTSFSRVSWRHDFNLHSARENFKSKGLGNKPYEWQQLGTYLGAAGRALQGKKLGVNLIKLFQKRISKYTAKKFNEIDSAYVIRNLTR